MSSGRRTIELGHGYLVTVEADADGCVCVRPDPAYRETEALVVGEWDGCALDTSAPGHCALEASDLALVVEALRHATAAARAAA